MISLREVTKSYSTPHGRRYVFRNLNFTFPEAANIGLIGPNGAGKSTLMRLLGGIDSPDEGAVESNSSISWPVGLSGGMQGSLSGRDNVRFVCRVYGAGGATMRAKLRYVEDFAAIGEYFDLPVKSYSSGMRSRLAFGLSMAFDFDYYLIDEVMAVGDAQFRAKCQQAFRSRLASSNMILVSHNMSDIKQWCDQVVLVKDGTARLYDDVDEGIAAYLGGHTQGPVPQVRRKRVKSAVSATQQSQTVQAVAGENLRGSTRLPSNLLNCATVSVSAGSKAAECKVEDDNAGPPTADPSNQVPR